MNEQTLLRAAMSVAILGIVALLVISTNSELETTKAYEADRTKLNKKIRIKGTIKDIRETEKAFLLEIIEEKLVTVVVFKDGKASFTQRQQADITGQLREYKGKREIIAEKVKLSDVKECS